MGIFSRRSKGKGRSAQGPTTVTRHGAPVLEVTDTFIISGRGLVLTGRVLAPVSRDEHLAVVHDGTAQDLRLARITVDDEMVDSVDVGVDAALLLTKSDIDAEWFVV